MANLVVTSTTNSIKVDFGVLATAANMKKGVWNKSRITFQLALSDTHVDVLVIGEPSWGVSFDGSSSTLQIDSVDGVSPTSNSDLYDKLIALIA
jgi:hypothetical protein